MNCTGAIAENPGWFFQILILPAIAVFAGLGCPGVHTKRQGCSRVSVTVREFVFGISALAVFTYLTRLACWANKIVPNSNAAQVSKPLIIFILYFNY
jgi:hypothetical protein